MFFKFNSNKQKMKKFLVIALAIGSIVGCKKKDDTPAQLEVTAANIAGVYKITAETEVINNVSFDRYNGGTIGGQTYAAEYETCEKDDTFTFTATNVTSSEGATSCTPPTPSLNATYVVQTSSKTLSIPSFGISGTIESLTATGMVLKSTETSGGITSVTTTTFSK